MTGVSYWGLLLTAGSGILQMETLAKTSAGQILKNCSCLASIECGRNKKEVTKKRTLMHVRVKKISETSEVNYTRLFILQ